jgi:hypothetical protein
VSTDSPFAPALAFAFLSCFANFASYFLDSLPSSPAGTISFFFSYFGASFFSTLAAGASASFLGSAGAFDYYCYGFGAT